MRIAIINAYPDKASYCDALFDAYVAGARDAGHDVRSVALRDSSFELVLHGGFQRPTPLEPDLLAQQALIKWCEHLVIVSPNWWWSAPAVLKAFIERVFLPEFAMRYRARFPYVEPLLTR